MEIKVNATSCMHKGLRVLFIRGGEGCVKEYRPVLISLFRYWEICIISIAFFRFSQKKKHNIATSSRSLARAIQPLTWRLKRNVDFRSRLNGKQTLA